MAEHITDTVDGVGNVYAAFPPSIEPGDYAGNKPCAILEPDTADIDMEMSATTAKWNLNVHVNLLYPLTTDTGVEFNICNVAVDPVIDAFMLDGDDTNIHTKIPELTGRVSRIQPTVVVYSQQTMYAGMQWATARVTLNIKFHRKAGS